jgi:hypothetical protein
VFRRTPFFLALHAVVFGLKPRIKALVRPYMRSWRKPVTREGADDA